MEFKIILSVFLILFQCLDVVLTEKILAGGGEELNPLIKRFGYWIKIPVVVGCIVAGFLAHPIILVAPILLSFGICVWNFIVYRKING